MSDSPQTVYSIKLQIIATFLLLAIPVVAMIYFYGSAHRQFHQSLDQVIETEAISNLVQKIERDLVDLQRNVLIFKETASTAAVKQVESLYSHSQQSIAELLKLESISEDPQELQRATKHLLDYKNNFDVVVQMRNERSNLIKAHLMTPLIQRSANIAFEAKNHVLMAHAASLSYLASYDPDYISSFKSHIHQFQDQIKNQPDLATLAAGYEQVFLRIIALSRHYVFLINVVMAGSANEVLYNTRELERRFAELSASTRDQVHASMAQQKQWMLTIGIGAAVFSAIILTIFYMRLTRPILLMTQVFKDLSAGEKTSIPALNRRDEVGSLASAANVFREKNELTEALLEHSKSMVRKQQELNEALTSEKLRAEKALSARTDFLANMSHELRTPLNSIIGFTARIARSKALDERTQSALEIIQRNGEHLLAMINDILDLSKVEADKLDLQFQTVDLPSLCQDCISQILPSAEDKGLDIYSAINPVPKVQTDPNRLRQVLLNILSNAVKYTERGDISLRLGTIEGTGKVLLEVIDTGIGIRQEDQEKLFQRFEQFDNPNRYKVGTGTGLGLSIVSKISDLLGIKVSIVSEFGEGTQVCLLIPARSETLPVPDDNDHSDAA